MVSVEERVSPLNSLLRGELSAVETYEQALARVDHEPGSEALRQVQAEHREAAAVLRQFIIERGGKPAADSGAWGTWAKVLAGAATLFGDAAALTALREGEQHGVASYQSALAEEHLDDACKELIRATLLPQTEAHVGVLDRFLKPATA